MRKFGITIEQYEEMLVRQDGGCAICGRPPGRISLHVDHDHETNRVGGLLCFRCNNSLGDFVDHLFQPETAHWYRCLVPTDGRPRHGRRKSTLVTTRNRQVDERGRSQDHELEDGGEQGDVEEPAQRSALDPFAVKPCEPDGSPRRG